MGLRFREVIEKIKEKARQKKKNNLKNLQNGQENVAGKTRIRANLEKNFRNIVISQNFLFEIPLKGC